MSDRSTVLPGLAYDDAPAAIEFLCRAFGFEERFRLDMPDGSIGHAELSIGNGAISLATTWEAGNFCPPHRLSAVHSQIQIEVDDVDAHYERAKGEGAIIAEPPEDQFHGSRSYRAMDPEGHRWIFNQHLREVSVEEMEAVVGTSEA